MRTNEELKQIAVDLYSNNIFSSAHMEGEEENIKLHFTPLCFLNEEQLKEMEEKDIVFIYEYVSEAGPQSLDGKPVFFSFRSLSRKEAVIMFEYYEKLCNTIEKI